MSPALPTADTWRGRLQRASRYALIDMTKVPAFFPRWGRKVASS